MKTSPSFSVISLFPELIRNATAFGILGRAIKQGSLTVDTFNPRDFSDDERRTIDDSSFGGGPGMVMKVVPLRRAIAAAKESQSHTDEVIYLSPQGKHIDQADIFAMAKNAHTILLAGRYEGVDQRLIDADVTRELSLGDFVMSGGEFAALSILDAVSRTIPGVLGNELSVAEDSFYDGLLDHPHYTRPETVDGAHVPKVLMSGDHAAIRRWRRKMSLGQTWLKRPDIIDSMAISAEDELLLTEFKAEQNVK